MIRLARTQLALACADCGYRWEVALDELVAGASGPECPECGGWFWAGDYAVPRPAPNDRPDRLAS